MTASFFNTKNFQNDKDGCDLRSWIETTCLWGILAWQSRGWNIFRSHVYLPYLCGYQIWNTWTSQVREIFPTLWYWWVQDHRWVSYNTWPENTKRYQHSSGYALMWSTCTGHDRNNDSSHVPMSRKDIVTTLHHSTTPRQHWNDDTIPLAQIDRKVNMCWL